ncbi:hypothetical protein ZWY2020_013130 [Hordeum vulgare]|nr:hypothetical protein ZWY2020_013130 [Hordeum vulgare]
MLVSSREPKLPPGTDHAPPALDRGFRHLLAQRATATSGYDSSLLRGVSYKVEDSDADSPVRVVQRRRALRAPRLQRHPQLRARRLVQRPRRAPPPPLPPLFSQSIEEGPLGSVLRVYHSFTGAISVLPPVSIRDYRKHALLSVEDNGRAFELLVADERLRFQIYSSREGR